MMKNVCKGIFLLAFFFMNTSVAFSVDVGDFSALQGAIQGQQTPINITVPAINFSERLGVDYSTIFTSPLSQVTFDGQNQSPFFTVTQPTTFGTDNNTSFTFQNAFTSAGAIINRDTSLTFNGPTNFIGNVAVGQGGGGLTAVSSQITFNGSAFFSRNSTSERNGAGILLTENGSSTMIFNDTATFINNTSLKNGAAVSFFGSVTFNGPTVFKENSAVSGGAVYTRGTLTFNDTATFINNTASDNGGAIYISPTSLVTFRTTNPSAPTVFQGNTPNAIYFNGSSTLIMDTGGDTTIDIQDGIASSNNTPIITKQGSGTWQQSGNSTSYQGTTNVVGGALKLEPGARYGSTSSGTFTLGPGGTLVFNIAEAGTGFPLLQAANMTLNGITTVGMLESGEGVVIQSGTPINGGSFSAGDILNQGKSLFYDWRFVFTSPTQVVLSAVETTTIEREIIDAGGDANDIEIAEALDAFDEERYPGLLADYIEAIKNAGTREEVLRLIDPLHGEILTGSHGLLWNQMTNFSIQVDERLDTPLHTAMNSNQRVQLASVDKTLPLSYGSRSPWIGWGQILGGRGHQSSYRGANGYDSVNGGLIAGFDRFLDPSWRLGGAVTYQRGRLDWARYNAETRDNTVGGVVYGAYSRDGWFAQSQVGGGGSRVKNQRDIPLAVIGHRDLTAYSSTTLPFFLGRAEGGYHFDYQAFRFTPSAGLLYLHSRNKAYAESGADQFNLSIQSGHRNSLEAQGFFEVAYNALIHERPVTFRVNYGLGYSALNKKTILTTGFLAFPDLPTFQASSLNLGRWRQIAEVGMNVEVAKNVRLRFDYLGLFTPHQYNQTGAVGLKALF